MLQAHLLEMTSLAENEPVPLVKMHIFGHMAVYPELVGQIKAALLFLLDDKSVFTRSWAIASLCIIARKDPQECQDFLEHLVPLQGDQSIAIRLRVKKAINLLTDIMAQFPKGWVKSEHLQGL